MTRTKRPLTSHPTKWEGKSFRNKITGNIHVVKEVRRRGSSYRILLDSDIAMLSEIGFDSKIFNKNWVHVGPNEK